MKWFTENNDVTKGRFTIQRSSSVTLHQRYVATLEWNWSLFECHVAMRRLNAGRSQYDAHNAMQRNTTLGECHIVNQALGSDTHSR